MKLEHQLAVRAGVALMRQTRDDDYAEARFYAGSQLPVRLYERSYGMGRLALSSALFRVGRGERGMLKISLPTFRGGAIFYEGPELRQDDATVLLALVHGIRKRCVDDTVQIDPVLYSKSLGWSGCSRAVARLRESIERMQTSMIRIERNLGSSERAHLVGDFRWSNRHWEVRLKPTVIGLFEGGTTFLPIEERRQLTDGLQTWLAGFLRAQSDETQFSIDDLRRFSGASSDLSEFGKQLRDTMPKLRAARVVSGFAFKRGALTVERAEVRRNGNRSKDAG